MTHSWYGSRVSTRAARSLAALFAALSGFGLSLPTLAADPPAPGASSASASASDAPVEEEDDPDLGIRRRGAPDTRAGHFLIDAKGGLTAPTGSFGSGLRAGTVVAAGPLVGGSLGFGVSRQVLVEASGSYSMLSGGSSCPDCSATGYDVGLGLTYHVAQGIAFDPWMSFSVAYRALSIDGGGQPLPPDAGGGPDASFAGIDVARFSLGGSFYPIPSLGFGPYLGVDLGTFLKRPEVPDAGDDAGPGLHAFFHLGLRVSFDPIRAVRGTPVSVGTPHTPAATRPTPASVRSRQLATASPALAQPAAEAAEPPSRRSAR
jgi:hypothetical protein